MAQVELRNLGKTYDGNVKAVDSVTIMIEDHEFVVFVGPSGCGKSTTLRMIAGLEDISAGDLFIDNQRVNDVAPKDRNIAMVFQNYALYPHMSVYENMAFGLRMHKVEKHEIDRRVRDAAKILDIETLLERKPKALSGGQRQRVAVGRAIVRNPKVFLFDEPLSNLDAKLRIQMRAEISELHHRLNATMIYVTHDQVEAMTMGDKIVVMKDGKINQIGSPLYIYNHPINKFVAGFIGAPPMNFMTVKIIEDDGALWIATDLFRIRVAQEHEIHLRGQLNREVYFGIRPENLAYQEDAQEDQCIPAKISVIEPLGAEIHLKATTPGHAMIARVPPQYRFKVGEGIHLAPQMRHGQFFDHASEVSLLPAQWDEQAQR